MRYIISSFLLLVMTTGAQAAIRTSTVEYRQGDAVLEGYLAYDDASKSVRPGVLVVHEWWGINNYIRKRTEQLARLGYVAFAADIYGKGNRATSREEAVLLSGKFKNDRLLMRERALAGLETLRKNSLVDMKRIAAIGYCFGGAAVLELARSGVDMAGVVSFHGNLDTPTPGDAKNIKGRVLALAGGDDPFVPAQQVIAFEDEMRKGGVDWQVVTYGSAVHAFTNPENGTDNSRGAAYNEKADRRSWEAMKVFFGEIFK